MATIVLLIAQFYLTNMPGSHSLKGARYDLDKKMGEFIKEKSSKDEVVVINEKPSPQMVFYAGRNIFYSDRSEASINFRHKRWQDTHGAVMGYTNFNFEHDKNGDSLSMKIKIIMLEDTAKKDEPVEDSPNR
jgi:hypothetical protein